MALPVALSIKHGKYIVSCCLAPGRGVIVDGTKLEIFEMKRPAAHKNDRLPVRRSNPTTPQAREKRVIAGLVAQLSDFVYLVQWLKSGKQNGDPLQLSDGIA